MLLSARDPRGEQMDDPTLDPETYRAVLGDLAVVNRYTFAARPTLDFLKRAVGGRESFRLLDVGFGQGDMLRRIAGWARREGIGAELIGIDLNPNSAAVARAVTPATLGIDYRTGDYRSIEGPLDCIVSSLVAHHMSGAELREFIGFMERRAGRGWFINDLHRHPVAWLGYPVLAWLLRVHPIVRQDGTLSIARSFRPDDWRAILRASGVGAGVGEEARIIRRAPFRLCVERLF